MDELEAEEDSASRAVLFKSDLGRKCRVSGGLRHGIPPLSWIVYFFELYHRSWGVKRSCGCCGLVERGWRGWVGLDDLFSGWIGVLGTFIGITLRKRWIFVD